MLFCSMKIIQIVMNVGKIFKKKVKHLLCLSKCNNIANMNNKRERELW
jgi:hypothetical protein